MDKLFNLVLYSTISATIAGLVILVIKLLLKSKLSPKYVYVLWLVFILKLVIPFAPENSISLFNKININNQYSNTLNYNLHESNKSILLNTLGIANKLKSETFNFIENSDSEFYKYRYIYINTMKYASYIWFSTFIVLMIVLILSYYKLMYELKTSSIVSDRIRYIFINCKKKCRVSRNIELIITDKVEVPAIFKIIKPKILLPANLYDLSDQEIEFIFIHYIFKRVRQDIELATDYRVSNLLEPEELILYGITILTVLSRVNNKIFKPILINMINDKNNVEERIMNIKNISKYKNKKLTLTLIGVLTICIVSPLILVNTKQNIIYANSSYKTSLQDKELNILQDKFFEISTLLKDNPNLTISKVDEILENTNYLSKYDKSGVFIVYKYENEEIVLSKNKKDKSRVNVITYSLFNPNKYLNVVSLSSEHFDDSKYKSSIQICSTSLDKIHELAIKLDTEVANSNLYKNYRDIINQSKNGKLDNSVFLKINPNLKIQDIESPGASYYQDSSKDYTLSLCSINKTKELDNVMLSKCDKDGEFVELLDTFNLNCISEEIRNNYNLQENIYLLHSLSINNKNSDTIKKIFLKSIY